MNTPTPLDAIPLPPLPEPAYLGHDSDDGAIYGYDTAHMNNHARLAVTEALAAQAAAQPTVVASGAEMSDSHIKRLAEKADLVWSQGESLYVSMREDVDIADDVLKFARSVIAALSTASTAPTEPTLAVKLAEQVLHMEMVTEKGRRASELARQVIYGRDEVVHLLKLIEHATAPTPDDDGGHENAYELAVEALAVLRGGNPAAPQPLKD